MVGKSDCRAAEQTKGGMVYTRATWRRWETVADALCEIVQQIWEIDSFLVDEAALQEWHWELCFIMEEPTATSFSQSLRYLAESIATIYTPEFEVAVNRMEAWWTPFESLGDIEASMGEVLEWLRMGREGYQPEWMRFNTEGSKPVE